MPQYIESPAAEIFRALHGEGLLRGLPRDAFTERLTYYLGEVNAVHPFREGNGRAHRAFEQLDSDAGFTLGWQHLDADRNVAASAAIMHGDPAPMRKMPDELLREASAQQGSEDNTSVGRPALTGEFTTQKWNHPCAPLPRAHSWGSQGSGCTEMFG
ncbi:MAG TPA: Fic family protein [Trebonia sp.]|nr:Fic family protein [Trebonia sp.]